MEASQSVIARNIANVNTPGYISRDPGTFKAMVAGLSDWRNPNSFTINPSVRDIVESAELRSEAKRGSAVTKTLSGNVVDLEAELARGAAISRDYSLITGVVRVFHQMTISASR